MHLEAAQLVLCHAAAAAAAATTHASHTNKSFLAGGGTAEMLPTAFPSAHPGQSPFPWNKVKEEGFEQQGSFLACWGVGCPPPAAFIMLSLFVRAGRLTGRI